MKPISEHPEIISRLGGTATVARLCGVSSQAVSKWKRTGIPSARLMYLQLAKPDAFAGFPAFMQVEVKK